MCICLLNFLPAEKKILYFCILSKLSYPNPTSQSSLGSHLLAGVLLDDHVFLQQAEVPVLQLFPRQLGHHRPLLVEHVLRIHMLLLLQLLQLLLVSPMVMVGILVVLIVDVLDGHELVHVAGIQVVLKVVHLVGVDKIF